MGCFLKIYELRKHWLELIFNGFSNDFVNGIHNAMGIKEDGFSPLISLGTRRVKEVISKAK